MELLEMVTQKIGAKLVEVTTRQGNIPFYRGDLRKSIVYQTYKDRVIIGTNLSYARAVHDGRPALTFGPKRAKVLSWWTDPEKQRQMLPFPKNSKAFREMVKGGQIRVARRVKQKARPANPFFARALQTLRQEGLGFLKDDLELYLITDLEKVLRG
ncbi:MAG: hypothetical protein B6247_07770 [Candidatus Parabeggiatoa sp. nov. 2]|nr:MAG: hypothetical protein B6247_07770 [Beggiatoa sp. 4572_84]